MANAPDASPGYVPGDFWRICDRTGFKVRASETRREWNGQVVWKEVWEPRHPQDFVRGRKDNMAVPEARPRQPDVFLDPGDVTAGDL